MAVKPIFTAKRRNLIAKTFMDTYKILLAAIFASEFLLKLPGLFKIYFLFGILFIFILGIFISPKEGGE